MEPIRIFCKYQRCNQHTLDNLEKNQFYFNHPIYFNDPFDCKLIYIHRGTEEKWVDWFKNRDIDEIKAKKQIERNLTERRFKKEGLDIIYDRTNEEIWGPNNPLHGSVDREHLPLVACFTETDTNILMWSHYADNHQGICLRFKAKPTTGGHYICLDSHLPSPLMIVNYSDDMANPVNMIDLNERLKLIYSGLTTKYSAWEYEKEYRILHPIDKFISENTKMINKTVNGGIMKYDKHDLEGVIFGLNISLKNAKAVYEIISNEYLAIGIYVNLYQAKEIRGKYALQIEPISNIDKYFASFA